MIKIENSHFSIEQICESGQCFRIYKQEAGKYRVTALGNYLEIINKEEGTFFDCTEEEYLTLWKHYFDLETDYQLFFKGVTEKDGYLFRAMQYGSGIRILNQELWEVVISFIISQQNNIKRIRRSIELLCTRFGEKALTKEGKEYYLFPTPEALLTASEVELTECNLGYRGRYIRRTAESIVNREVDLAKIKKLDYQGAKTELLKLYGVGNKVADCICLFALHQLEAFPVDTHINKVLEEHYPEGFPFKAFEGFSGVLQQYLFFYDLKKGGDMKGRKAKTAFPTK